MATTYTISITDSEKKALESYPELTEVLHGKSI